MPAASSASGTRTGPPEVIVVGGGLIGALVAFTLRQAGADVLVLDAGRPGAAWRAAAGLLTPDGEGLRQSPLWASAQESLRRWPRLAQRLEAVSGQPVFFREGVRRLQAEGPAQVTPGEGSLHPPSVVGAARRHVPVLPARVLALTPGPRGVRVVTDQGDWTAPTVVLAAGVWSAAFGVRVRAVQGQALRLASALNCGAVYGPPARGFARYALTRPDGVYVGATSRASWRVTPDERAARWLRGVARQLVPGAAMGRAAPLVGLRPVTASGQPLVGPHPTLPGVVVATGHGRHGALLAPVTAQQVLTLVQAGAYA
ncbi:FAD-dependent oxidoreductase [Deinococcus sp. HMF7620]|uniref:FAD-dependent oxidoreductase n=1 Tax=Deinococcus arboris TaxID=2682977 RepID=A0A7C9M7V9_9DEIO|nr:FAD-dependent oxidoreductase [Deinococcus arboris]MVN86439.1 FAD-dependent oxidoreductase [Deinococcus arboris]